jgi:hypothetical protein
MDSNDIRSFIDLSGPWQAHLEPGDSRDDGSRVPERWEESVLLPGALSSQGFGDEVGVDTPWIGDIFDTSWFTEEQYEPYRRKGNIKVPYWLQPDRRYVGPAWYRKTVEVPRAMAGKRLSLVLERPHWETRLWFDGRYVGSNDSLSVPHEYDLGVTGVPGGHTIELRIDNRMIFNIGPNSHSMADHTQGDWNGVVGSIRLVASSPVWIEGLEIFPSLARRTAVVRARIGNTSGSPKRGRITIGLEGRADPPALESAPLEFPPGVSVEHLEYRLGDGLEAWDEFAPHVERLTASLTVGGIGPCDSLTSSFGLREVGTVGTRIALNGRPLFLRGTLECCVFPLTGYPPTDHEPWRTLYGRVKAHGLNHVRFHSWCPPEAAFDAADEAGVFLQIECSTWANQGAGVGTDARFDEWLYREGERIVSRFGNHPSFIMMAYGNEPDGRTEEFLGSWVSYWKGRDDRRVYTTAAGWPAIPENDYHNIPQPRAQAWGEGLDSRINAKPPETRTDYRSFVERYAKPIVSHEIGQWCSFPNFDEIEKYRGPLKAKNMEIFRDFLEAKGMGDQARDFLIASGKLQAACYKEEIESALRTPGFAGFQLLGLSDFPGQGTALVGVLDAFGDEKGYVTPAEFRESSGVTVPLALLDKRYWRVSESLEADLEVAHFGPATLDQADVAWQLLDSSGKPVADGRFPGLSIPTGSLTPVGRVSQPLSGLPSGARYELVVSVEARDAGGPHSGSFSVVGRNRWDVWAFPDRLETGVPDGVHVAHELDDASRAVLDRGGKVLLLLTPSSVDSDVALGFSSVFWNTAWTKGQAPHTLGLLCDPGHPAFADFPTRSYSDWLWWELVHGAAAMVMDRLPRGFRPLVQPIDTWFRNHRLGLLFEARVGKGSLLVSSMDLDSDLSRRLVARQMRHSLLRYMASPAFDPEAEVSFEDVVGLSKKK